VEFRELRACFVGITGRGVRILVKVERKMEAGRSDKMSSMTTTASERKFFGA